MNTTDMSQSVADILLAMEKYAVETTLYEFPALGGRLCIPLENGIKTEFFSLDIWRSSIQLKKNTFQQRVRKGLVLARIDLGGPPHQNPDGKKILCPHIHLYKEGYDDKWAYPLPKIFTNPGDISMTMDEFMRFCNIVRPPIIERNMFV